MIFSNPAYQFVLSIETTLLSLIMFHIVMEHIRLL